MHFLFFILERNETTSSVTVTPATVSKLNDTDERSKVSNPTQLPAAVPPTQSPIIKHFTCKM